MQPPTLPETSKAPGPVAPAVTDVINPINGEIIDLADADAIGDALETVRTVQDRLTVFRHALITGLVALAPAGDERTRRVRGHRRRLILTAPDRYFDQAKLKAAWHSYPQFREQLLRIGRLEVGLRELAKVEHESGPADWMQFRAMVLGAERPATALPSVKIEE